MRSAPPRGARRVEGQKLGTLGRVDHTLGLVNTATLHLVLVAVWFGILLAEFVLELLPLRRPELQAATAAFHFYIDLLAELPVLLGIVATGAWLLRDRAIDARLAVKLAGAAVAIVANLVCVGVVIARHRCRPEDLDRRSRLVRSTAAVGVPGGLVALTIGLGYAGWW